MSRKEPNVYKACDEAITAMNRENLEAFGRLKMSKWDEIRIVREVLTLYRTSAKKARKRYLGVAFDAYMLAMEMCDRQLKKAREMAKKAITLEWVDGILEQTDFVTLYRFDSETERKAYRLAETLEVSDDRSFEIDKALRYWSQQLAQYAINFTDYAMVQAFQDAGVEMVQWNSQRDERVCNECHAYDGQVFYVDEVPRKHWACRCYLRPVFRKKEA